MFFCEALTGRRLTVRINEMSRSNIIAELASLSERRRKRREKRKFQSRQANARRDVSRMAPTLGSDLYATRNGGSNPSGPAGFEAWMKRRKRAKLECQH